MRPIRKLWALRLALYWSLITHYPLGPRIFLRFCVCSWTYRMNLRIRFSSSVLITLIRVSATMWLSSGKPKRLLLKKTPPPAAFQTYSESLQQKLALLFLPVGRGVSDPLRYPRKKCSLHDVLSAGFRVQITKKVANRGFHRPDHGQEESVFSHWWQNSVKSCTSTLSSSIKSALSRFSTLSHSSARTR